MHSSMSSFLVASGESTLTRHRVAGCYFVRSVQSTIIGQTTCLLPPLISSRYGMNRSESLPHTRTACFLTVGYGRTAPISNLTFPTSTETITSVRFNLSEASVLASVGSDRTFTLYDIRTGKAERRVIMQVGENIRSSVFSGFLILTFPLLS